MAPTGPGHESGHEPAPPVGFSWEGYLLAFVEDLGGWAALTDELIRRGTGLDDLPTDPGVVEKGLRRLSKRGQKTGGQYGRWMLRLMGLPASLEQWARWMGQFHNRFADLPTSLRFEQLSLWDRPPVTESKMAAWIHLGLASVLTRMQRDQAAELRLQKAEAGASAAGVACQIEATLMRAKLLTDLERRTESERLFDRAEVWLGSTELLLEDKRAYHARLVGQRAYHLTRSAPGMQVDLHGARALFESIEDEPFLPFVAFRKANGLAYCDWQLGDLASGQRFARLAEQHAGDGGLVRFRIMALNLLGRMLPAPEALPVRARAERLAQLLEDEDLLRRVRKRW